MVNGRRVITFFDRDKRPILGVSGFRKFDNRLSNTNAIEDAKVFIRKQRALADDSSKYWKPTAHYCRVERWVGQEFKIITELQPINRGENDEA